MLIKIHPPGAGKPFISPALPLPPKKTKKTQGIAEDAGHLNRINFLLTGKEREMAAG